MQLFFSFSLSPCIAAPSDSALNGTEQQITRLSAASRILLNCLCFPLKSIITPGMASFFPFGTRSDPDSGNLCVGGRRRRACTSFCVPCLVCAAADATAPALPLPIIMVHLWRRKAAHARLQLLNLILGAIPFFFAFFFFGDAVYARRFF